MTTTPEFTGTFKHAMDASAQGDADNAIRLFREASAENPAWALPPFLLGAELAQVGRHDEAMQAFAAAVLLAPDLHIARFQLGLLQYTSGQAALALVTWHPLSQLAEAHPLREFVLGFAALADNRFEEAISRFRAGQQLNTDNPPLNGDIEMLIGKVEAVMRANAAENGPEAAAHEAADADIAHVLLSNYQNGSFH